MKISVFGLGYVGAVTAGCLTHQGHQVVGVDVSAQKVETVNRGESPMVEPGLEDLLKRARQRGLLRATTDSAEAVATTDASLVCVGTPSTVSGAVDLRFVRQVTGQIADALRAGTKSHVLIFRSTMLPGSTQRLVDELLAEPAAANRLAVFYCPEFLREGTAVKDFLEPSLAVVGTRDGQRPATGLLELFGAGASVMNWPTAEMVKYTCNTFHAAKIAFANEIGRLSKQLGIDSATVMSVLCADTKLNISPCYLRPGNPFGGSCLPKDVRALHHFTRQQGVPLPLLENLMTSNEQHLRSLLQLIERGEPSDVIILGLSFKPNTDDLRESAMVEVAQHLLGRGYHVRIYDPQLDPAKLIGSNRRVMDTRMPRLGSLLHDDLALAIGERGLIVAAQRCATIAELAKVVTPRHSILDVNGWPELRGLRANYEGFCW